MDDKLSLGHTYIGKEIAVFLLGQIPQLIDRLTRECDKHRQHTTR